MTGFLTRPTLSIVPLQLRAELPNIILQLRGYRLTCQQNSVGTVSTGIEGGGAGGATAPQKVVIWWKSGKNPLKSGQNLWKSGQNVWKPSHNCCMRFEFTKMTSKIKVRTFFLEAMFLGKLGEVWTSLDEIWAKMLDVPWFEIVFFEVIFLEFFRAIWGNLGKNPSHPQKFACSYTYIVDIAFRITNRRFQLAIVFRTWDLVCINLSFASRGFVCARSTAFAQSPRFALHSVLSIGVDITFSESSFVSLAHGPGWLFLLSHHGKTISAAANQKPFCK